MGHLYNDLVFRCQWTGKLDAGSPYAFGVEYEAGNVDLIDAERIVCTLRKARRIEKDFVVQPKSFGQYCALMAKGLGITGLVKLVSSHGLSYADNEYREFPAKEMQHVIDAAIADCQKAEVAA